MGFVIGMRIRDKNLWLSGLKAECVGLALTVSVGFVFGLCTTWSETKWGASDSFPTYEMRTRSIVRFAFEREQDSFSRGDYRRLWAGALMALPSVSIPALNLFSNPFVLRKDFILCVLNIS